jgi:hypothetical protein
VSISLAVSSSYDGTEFSCHLRPTPKFEVRRIAAARQNGVAVGDGAEPVHAVASLGVVEGCIDCRSGVGLGVARRPFDGKHLAQRQMLPDITELAEVAVRHESPS